MNGIEKAVVTAVGRILAEHEKRLDDKIAAFDGFLADAFGKIDARLATLKDGESIKGDPGEPGGKGDKGDPGDKGEPGDKGDPGNDGAAGAAGEPGQSIKGDKGEPGNDGAPGGKGDKGDVGDKGDPGNDGAPGAAGAPGKDGESIKGDPGEPGLPGVEGAAWQPQGVYDETRAYHRLDVVLREGGSFVALRNNPGPCPGNDWQMLTGRGKTGGKGDKGDRGDRGDRGKDGVGIDDIVAKDGRLFVMLTDGRNLPFDATTAAT